MDDLELYSHTHFVAIEGFDIDNFPEGFIFSTSLEDGQEKEKEKEKDKVKDDISVSSGLSNNNDFNCPVCYTDGSSSGLVIPSCCSHKICLHCYTSIAVRANKPTCPMCRTDYLSVSPRVTLESNEIIITEEEIQLIIDRLMEGNRIMNEARNYTRNPHLNSDEMQSLLIQP